MQLACYAVVPNPFPIPLTDIIETDWLPYPFTMNRQMTRRGKVRFDKDEPVDKRGPPAAPRALRRRRPATSAQTCRTSTAS